MVELGNLKVRKADTHKDQSAILELINFIQPEIPWDLDHYDWQFKKAPSGGSELYVISDSDQIIALYAAIYQTLKTPNGTSKAVMIQDVMTHPEHRGNGYLHHLAGLCVDEMKEKNLFGYTFPNELSQKSFRRNGWTELCPVPERLKSLLDLTPTQSSLSPTEVSSFDEISTESFFSNTTYFIQRESSFLNWRYSKPHQNYLKFTLGKEGYFVLKHFKNEESSKLHILDLKLKAQSSITIKEVLSWIQNKALSLRADSLTAWVHQDQLDHQDYESFGFKNTQRKERFIFIYPNDSVNLEEISQLKHWHWSQGDSDVY